MVGENPARLKGHIDKILPKTSKVKRVRHFPALPYKKIGDFINQLRTQSGYSALALEFKILTAVRTGEIIGAKWGEIDIKEATWTIPSERMKAGREHRVPLSKKGRSQNSQPHPEKRVGHKTRHPIPKKGSVTKLATPSRVRPFDPCKTIRPT